MKLIKHNITKKGPGFVKLIPEKPEDMWHLYNFMGVGDVLQQKVKRKIITEPKPDDPKKNKKVKTELLDMSITVIDIEYHNKVSEIRAKGIISDSPEQRPEIMTMELMLLHEFTLMKDYWDSVAIHRLKLACKKGGSADVAIVVMQEGLAHVCLLTPYMTHTLAKIHTEIPSKQMGVQNHQNGLKHFYERTYEAILKHIDFEFIKYVVLASPGFVKDNFLAYMMEQASARNQKELLQSRSRFLCVHSFTGYMHSLNEILTDPFLCSKLAHTNAMKEMKHLEDFYQMLHLDSNRAYFGYHHVKYAHEAQAIHVLLISDQLLRTNKRKQYVELIESVHSQGKEVHILSSLHVSGEQLGDFAGIAAILKFPLPEPEDVSDSEDTSNLNE